MSWFESRYSQLKRSYQWITDWDVNVHQRALDYANNEKLRLETQRDSAPPNRRYLFAEFIRHQEQDAREAMDRLQAAQRKRDAVSKEVARHVVGWLYEGNAEGELSDEAEDSILQRGMELGATLEMIQEEYQLAESLIDAPLADMSGANWPQSRALRYDKDYAEQTAKMCVRRAGTLVAAGSNMSVSFLERYMRRFYRRFIAQAGIPEELIVEITDTLQMKVSDAIQRLQESVALPEVSEEEA